MRNRLLIFLSRLVNVLTFGKWELFCTRAVRNKWRWIIGKIDAVLGAGHSEASYDWDCQDNGRPR